MSNWDVSHELYIGMRFPSKEAITLALKNYHIHRHKDYVVDESKRRYFTTHCPRSDNGCSWRIRVSQSKDSNLWVVKKYVGPHTCVAPSMS